MKKLFMCALLVFAVMLAVPSFGLAKAAPQFADNKAMVEYFWNEVFNRHNTAVIDDMVGDIYIQHNPGFQDGKAAFKEGIIGFLAECPDSTAAIKHIGADGDLVFVHNHIKLNETDRGQAAMDIFRVENGKIVEHWDIIQDIPETAENSNTMF